ncbi:SoxR reducing system RseC family protein [Serpentinicella sp. ANB-PHB4]|uniref:SoxR reducing system RseC family protein n=1 Tax=Serpentinicella sp. ANB-PHB4 TaxID=3074076 RepID=UPI002856F34E|nr:SoxR reducing system RseC family protein [Serpentinicella sp. ANB-PHB4]MDR5658076.1 SoxR reducing system RseC family protein [Serpentinicella sp. ANB-PHB4]
MKRQGTVTQILGDNAKVQIRRHSSCEKCNACSAGREKSMEVIAINKVNAQVGEEVSLDLESQNVLKAAFIIYMIPLITLLVGISISMALFSRLDTRINVEMISAIIGVLSMALTFVIIRSKNKQLESKGKYTPIISEII